MLQHLIKEHPAPHNNSHDLPHAYEILNASLTWDASKISIYSDKNSAPFPIMFALSAFCWTLSGHTRPHNLLKSLTPKMIDHILNNENIPNFLARVQQAIKDLLASHNQSEFNLFQMSDLIHLMPEIPHKAEMWFIIRDNHLNLIVNAQSSDIISSLPIDAFQYQIMFRLFLNELNEISPRKMLPGQIYYNIGSLYMTQEDLPFYKKINFPAYKFEYQIKIYQSYANVQNRSSKRFADARTLSHLLDILDIGAANKIMKIQKIFKKRLHRMSWQDF